MPDDEVDDEEEEVHVGGVRRERAEEVSSESEARVGLVGRRDRVEPGREGVCSESTSQYEHLRELREERGRTHLVEPAQEPPRTAA